MSWAGPFAWGPVTSSNTPTGLYAGGRIGGAFTQAEASNVTVYTLNVLDPSSIFTSGSGGHLSGGGFVGLSVVQLMGLMFGLEFGADFADKNMTFISNVNNTVTNTQTDRLQFEYNHIFSLSGTVSAPINRDISIYAKGGGSWMNATAHTSCVGSCAGAGTPLYTTQTDLDFTGFHYGFGAQGRLGTVWNRNVFWRIDYTHHEFGSQRIATGNPLNAAIAWDAQPDVDMLMFSMFMSFGGFPNMANGAPLTLSDVRTKRDIVRIGELRNGIGLYRFKYLTSDVEHVGVMAQEVAQVMPDAVETGADGFMRVNYARLGLKAQTFDEYQWSQTAAVQAAKRDCQPGSDFAMIVAALPDVLPVAR